MDVVRPARMLMVALLAATAASAEVSAQANCSWYAETALKQQQQNEKNKCGFTGEAWSSDLKAHIAWCSSVSPEVWKKAAQDREQDLLNCGSK